VEWATEAGPTGPTPALALTRFGSSDLEKLTRQCFRFIFVARKLVSSLAELFRRPFSEEIFSSPWSQSLSRQSKNGNDALVIDVGHLRDRSKS
jgi:hypothetical protein